MLPDSPNFSVNANSDPRGPAALDDPFYYMRNFRWVLDWVVERYRDLLSAEELEFASEFGQLPCSSQGLLVRMVMRKGEHFREDKLRYPELGLTGNAVKPLMESGWVTRDPLLDLPTLFKLFTWNELRRMLGNTLTCERLKNARKRDALAILDELQLPPQPPVEWGVEGCAVYELNVMPLCDRFRLMFFGNLHQDWSEFVLAELGTYRYEKVEFCEESRPFHSRAEIDAYLQLQRCRDRFYDGDALDSIAENLPPLPSANLWLVRGKEKLIFKLAREWERAGDLGRARNLYQACAHPEARCRLLRVLERQGQFALAFELAGEAELAPVSEAERQQVGRVLPRLRRKLGLPSPGLADRLTQAKAVKTDIIELTLPFSLPVELAVKQHLERDHAPVYYVENTLLTALFGLLCWDAVFAPLPGAFFHPFQRGPADLYWPDFYRRRAHLIDACLNKLESGDHRSLIQENYIIKHGIQSPFIHWASLSDDLLMQALNCIPAEHLHLIFKQLLRDLKMNCAGFPDLIQFRPAECRYRMIEVKGPGDRLQDNQRRWLDFFEMHNIPAAVCYMQWLDRDKVAEESA